MMITHSLLHVSNIN